MAVTLLVQKVGLEDHVLPHRRVKSFHGETGQMQWKHTREQIIRHIEKQHFHYYLKKDGRAVRIVLDQTSDGEMYIKAELDNGTPESLLQLPQFQPEAPKQLSAV